MPTMANRVRRANTTNKMMPRRDAGRSCRTRYMVASPPSPRRTFRVAGSPNGVPGDGLLMVSRLPKSSRLRKSFGRSSHVLNNRNLPGLLGLGVPDAQRHLDGQNVIL